MKFYVTIEIKSTKNYLPVVLFVILIQGGSDLEYVDELIKSAKSIK